MNKAQVALEFLAMVSISGVALLIFLGASYNIFQDTIAESKKENVMDFGRMVQQEIITASQVHPGYERTFTLPQTINGIDYSISLQDNYVMITVDGGDTPFRVPPVSGSLSKGEVTIKNIGGNVEVS